MHRFDLSCIFAKVICSKLRSQEQTGCSFIISLFKKLYFLCLFEQLPSSHGVLVRHHNKFVKLESWDQGQGHSSTIIIFFIPVGIIFNFNV